MEDLPFEQQLAWAQAQMTVTRAVCAVLPDMGDVRLAYSGHLSLNIIPALAAFLEHGAQLFLTTCNPSTVRDTVVAYLKRQGAEAHAWKDMPPTAYRTGIEKALAWQPTHTCEMGADLTAGAQAMEVTSIRAALEATGSGISRLSNQALSFPVFNWDDLPVKEGLHNRHMVGLTTWNTFFERTWLSLHGKRVVVVGYGLVGQGVADAARAFGGVVTVVEKEASRRLQARYAGWSTATLADVAHEADVVVAATGVPGVIDAGTLARLKPGCFLINVGHTPDEIDLTTLSKRREVLPHVEACAVGEHDVYLLAGGSMANLTAGRGDSLNAFDVTSAVMVAGVGFIVSEAEGWTPAVHPLPEAVWRQVAVHATTLEGW